MWQTKTWIATKKCPLAECKKRRDKWLKRNEGAIQFNEIIVANGYAVECRKLRRGY